MKSYLAACLSLLLCFSACSKKEAPVKINQQDFESLMGKDFPAWGFVKTKEDLENLHFFKKIFDDNSPLQLAVTKRVKIPKVVHFIWLGPKPFPRDSVENVRSWIAKNPDWTFKFWTDRERPLPHPAMQKILIKDLKLLQLASCYHKSDNYGEKSDLLRYEILFQEGGVYVDHDVECLRSFDAYNATYDFYCGLEMPHPTGLSTTVLLSNNLIAATPSHPIMKNCMDWLSENWDRIENDYPGKDKDSLVNRVCHRTFIAVGDSFKKMGNQNGRRDIAFPAFYFNAPKKELGVMAHHQYAGTWFENESHFERTARERLMKISKKTNQLILFISILTGINVVAFILLFRWVKHHAPKKE